MIKMAHTVTVAAAAASVLALAACGGASESAGAGGTSCTPKWGTFDTITSGQLTVGVPDAPPYYISKDGQTSGIDADFLNQFAKDSCLTIKWDVMPSASVIQSVVARRDDIAAGGWYSTAERGKVVNLSAYTYAELPTIISKTGADDVTSLVDHSVGTITGYAWVDDLKKKVGAGNVKEYQSADAALQDVAAGRIEFALLGGIDAPYLIKTKTDYSGIKSALMKPDESIAVSVNPSLPNYPATKGNDKLTAALNKGIDGGHTSGQTGKTFEKYGLDPALADVSKYK